MRYTEKQMKVIMDEWQSSGLRKMAFCQERSIPYATFHYWCRRLVQVAPTGFTEVTLPPERSLESSEIIFPSGARMILHGEPSVNWLREVVR